MRRFSLPLVTLFCVAVSGAVLQANEPVKDSGKPAAKCGPVSGVLFLRDSAKTWKAVKEGDMLPSGALLVGMPRAEIESASSTVKVKLLADVGQRGPYPVLEAGVVLHDAAGVDLDVTFDRGLIVTENLKKEGAAKVRLRVRDETWVLHLQSPGARIGLEIFGRQAPGLPKVIDAKTDVPTTDVLMLVLHGQAFLDTGTEGTGLHAPPGLARMHWDSAKRNHTFQRLEKLPETLVRPLDDKEEEIFKELSAAAAKTGQGEFGTRLDALLQSARKVDRFAGLTLAGGLDDLPRVFGVLMQSKDAATRDHAILVLRHWLGRAPGQITKLQNTLLERKKVTQVQARNLVHLLLGFDDEERGNPDTYEVLLTYLEHKNQGVRALAHWHLVRLAPAGRDIPFDPAAPEEERQQAVRRWHALIPDGQLPPRPKAP
jgi:hypothetical protein